MTFEIFVSEMKRGVAAVLGTEYDVTVRTVPKNNGIAMMGLVMKKKDGRVSPVIDLNPLYELYKNRNDTGNLQSMIQSIVERCREQEYESNQLYSNVRELEDYEKVRDKIIFKLINTENNQELLKQIPSVPFYDLSIVFILYMGARKDALITALIHKEHMDSWGVDEEKLYQEARKNTPRLLPETLTGINEIFQELNEMLRGEENDNIDVGQPDDGLSPFHILTNQIGIEGAVCMIYPNVMRKCSEKLGGDLLILPSSIHETLLLTYDNSVNVDEIRAMVQNINASEVPAEDQLSGQVYIYKRAEDRISIVV